MKRAVKKKPLQSRHLSRRAVLQLLGASAAGALVGSASEAYAAAQQPSAHEPNGTSRVVPLPAKPGPMAIDAAKTAVIVCDMQNDFGTKGGMFDRAGIDISRIQQAVGPTARVLAAARNAGMKIIYLKMAFRPDLSDLGSEDSPNRARHLHFGVGESVPAPDGTASRVLIRDTWHTDIVPELKPQAEDILLYKHRFSGFYQTELDAILKRMGIRFLIVTGCTTSVCVESTIRDGMFRDYSCVLLSDCSAEPIGQSFPRSNHEASLLTIQTILGWVATSEDFIQALAAPLAGKP